MSGMRRQSKRYVIAIVAASIAAATLTGCSDPLAPEEVLGFYRATSIPEPDQRTPVILPRILGITLQIDASRITRVIVYEAITGAGHATSYEEVLEMAYEIDGARLRTQPAGCPIEMLCAALLTPTPDFLFIGDGVMEVGKGSARISYRRAPVIELHAARSARR